MRVFHNNTEIERLPDYPYYVTMTDKTFSNPTGRWKGKINKFVVGCKTHKQAKKIQKKFKEHKDMIYVNVCSRKPSYNERNYIVDFRYPSEIGNY